MQQPGSSKRGRQPQGSPCALSIPHVSVSTSLGVDTLVSACTGTGPAGPRLRGRAGDDHQVQEPAIEAPLKFRPEVGHDSVGG